MDSAMAATQVRDRRHQSAIEAKCGINLIFAALVVWLGIAGIWSLSITANNRSVPTFVSGSAPRPLRST